MRPKSAETSKAVPVKLDRPLMERIEAISKKIGEAKSTVMRMAMRIGLDALEKTFEASPADLLKIVSSLETKNSSSSSSEGGATSGGEEKTAKKKSAA